MNDWEKESSLTIYIFVLFPTKKHGYEIDV
jgi:hypothetical protein